MDTSGTCLTTLRLPTHNACSEEKRVQSLPRYQRCVWSCIVVVENNSLSVCQFRPLILDCSLQFFELSAILLQINSFILRE